MILNLDTQFNPRPELTPIQFEAFTFKGGEPHIKITSDLSQTDSAIITHRLRSFNDIGLLIVAVDALRRMGVQKLKAILPYFPGARQDRVMVAGEGLTVRVYADLINNLHLDEVVIYDPHSDVAPALLDNCKAVNNHTFIKTITDTLSTSLMLVAPDGGALKKIYKLARELQDYEVVECGKTRNVQTGKLSGFKVHAEDLEGKDLLVVDDICDGGGTFIGLAEELKKRNSGKLYLAVSHGIFGKGFDILEQYYDHIYTTDAFQSFENRPQLTVIKLNEETLV